MRNANEFDVINKKTKIEDNIIDKNDSLNDYDSKNDEISIIINNRSINNFLPKIKKIKKKKNKEKINKTEKYEKAF